MNKIIFKFLISIFVSSLIINLIGCSEEEKIQDPAVWSCTWEPQIPNAGERVCVEISLFQGEPPYRMILDWNSADGWDPEGPYTIEKEKEPLKVCHIYDLNGSYKAKFSFTDTEGRQGEHQIIIKVQ